MTNPHHRPQSQAPTLRRRIVSARPTSVQARVRERLRRLHWLDSLAPDLDLGSAYIVSNQPDLNSIVREQPPLIVCTSSERETFVVRNERRDSWQPVIVALGSANAHAIGIAAVVGLDQTHVTITGGPSTLTTRDQATGLIATVGAAKAYDGTRLVADHPLAVVSLVDDAVVDAHACALIEAAGHSTIRGLRNKALAILSEYAEVREARNDARIVRRAGAWPQQLIGDCDKTVLVCDCSGKVDLFFDEHRDCYDVKDASWVRVVDL